MRQTSSVLIYTEDLGYALTNEQNTKFTDNLKKAFRFETSALAKKSIKMMSKKLKIAADKFKIVPVDVFWNDNFELTDVKIKGE